METLGRYEIRGELGRGGMGVVYHAYDPTLDREVAIKSVRLEGVDEAARHELEQRLSREARSAARLQHPNIVAIYDFFRVEDRAYIAMEYVKGSMLDAMILAGQRQNASNLLKVLKQVAAALDFAHKQGIIHRDIKPGNILLDEGGNIKITDFGIARVTTGGATETISSGMGSTVGTLGYMAPEQIRGEGVDGRADQFSLGIVAYQLFTGKMPFEADTWIALSYKIIHEAPPKVAGTNTIVTPNVEAALERAIAKQPGDRYESCSAFVAALERSAGGTETRASSAGPSSRSKTSLMAPALIGLMALAGYWIFVGPGAVLNPTKENPPVQNQPATTPGIVPPPVPSSPAAATKKPEQAEEQGIAGGIEFVAIPAGRFFMGSDSDEIDQRPRHMVQITKSFEMAATETTEKQWNQVMKQGPAGSNLPKTNVSWTDVQAFIARLNQAADGYLYRLPTEAEWEYAARGKTREERLKNPEEMAWYAENSGSKKHEVAQLMPNSFGLYDMLGNVFEWTGDWFEEGYYENSPLANPTGGKTGKMKINRGGGFETQGMQLSAAWRFADSIEQKLDNLGFRVVRVKR